MQGSSSLMLKRYNLGALGVTPLWLFRNGFWLSCVFYIVFAIYFWPGALVISLLFFIKGTTWSWGNGQRWSSAQEFYDSQHLWGIIGGVLLFLQAMAIVLWLSMYTKNI